MPTVNRHIVVQEEWEYSAHIEKTLRSQNNIYFWSKCPSVTEIARNNASTHACVLLLCAGATEEEYLGARSTTYLMIKFACVIIGGLGQVEDLIVVGVFGVEVVTDCIDVVRMV